MGVVSKTMPSLSLKASKRTIDDEDGEDIFDVPSVANFKCKILNNDSGRKVKLSDLVPDLEQRGESPTVNEKTQEAQQGK